MTIVSKLIGFFFLSKQTHRATSLIPDSLTLILDLKQVTDIAKGVRDTTSDCFLSFTLCFLVK